MVSEITKRIRGMSFALRVLLKALCRLAETAPEVAGVTFSYSQVGMG